MISMFLCLAAGISMTLASVVHDPPCHPTPGPVGQPGPITRCIQKGGYCYDKRCKDCPRDRQNEFLCPGENKICCLPKPPLFGCCELFGDPHIITFDGERYSVQKAGNFKIVAPCQNPDFQVSAVFYFPPLVTRFTMVESVTVLATNGGITQSATIRLAAGGGLEVEVNGAIIPVSNLPQSVGPFRIRIVGITIYIWIPSKGILICFNGRYLKIYVNKNLFNKLCGLCGQYNDDIRDDLVDAMEHQTFDEGCPPGGRPEDMEKCKEIFSRLRENCKRKITPKKFLEECAQDECMEAGASKYTIEAYNDSCDEETNNMFEDMVIRGEEQPA